MVERLPFLHYAVKFGCLSVVHVLLAAGADERALSPDGKRASDMIEQGRPPAEEAAIGRMLERGAAFRARSWTWLAGVNSRIDEALPLGKPGSSVNVRVFRQENGRVCITRFAR